MLGALTWTAASKVSFVARATGAQGPAKSQGIEVKIDNFSFMPQDITVAPREPW